MLKTVMMNIDDSMASCPGEHDLNLCFVACLPMEETISKKDDRAAWELRRCNWVRGC